MVILEIYFSTTLSANYLISGDFSNQLFYGQVKIRTSFFSTWIFSRLSFAIKTGWAVLTKGLAGFILKCPWFAWQTTFLSRCYNWAVVIHFEKLRVAFLTHWTLNWNNVEFSGKKSRYLKRKVPMISKR